MVWTKEYIKTAHPYIVYKHHYKQNKVNVFITKYRVEDNFSFQCSMTLDLPNGDTTYNSVKDIWFKDENEIKKIKGFYGIDI